MSEPSARAKKAVAQAPVDLDRIARAVREILSAVGEDPDREGLRETPQRVAGRSSPPVSRNLTQPATR